ncbi:MAG: hypothetical protein BRD27_05510 [Bacteroidetes bacterium QH_10_64_19]|nr:MAG: hypothetical protein BRD27_05510 [Bacteroidetes bacterium QH_10_64_19]
MLARRARQYRRRLKQRVVPSCVPLGLQVGRLRLRRVASTENLTRLPKALDVGLQFRIGLHVLLEDRLHRRIHRAIHVLAKPLIEPLIGRGPIAGRIFVEGSLRGAHSAAVRESTSNVVDLVGARAAKL